MEFVAQLVECQIVALETVGSSPTGHPTKKSADALHRRIFLFGGVSQWDSNKAALTHQRQSNQQPSGLLVSLRVPISRNVYQDKCCADALHRRIFYLVGVSQWDSNSTPLFSAKKACAEHLWPERLLCALHMLFIV